LFGHVQKSVCGVKDAGAVDVSAIPAEGKQKPVFTRRNITLIAQSTQSALVLA
jgi:hypothetical protein